MLAFIRFSKGPPLPQRVKNHGVRGSSRVRLEENADSSRLGAHLGTGLAVFAPPPSPAGGIRPELGNPPKPQLWSARE